MYRSAIVLLCVGLLLPNVESGWRRYRTVRLSRARRSIGWLRERTPDEESIVRDTLLEQGFAADDKGLLHPNY